MPEHVTFERLTEMTVAELDDVFASGDVPSVRRMQGDLSETVLAGRGALRSRRLRGFVNTPLNPWKGKRVEAYDDDTGGGVNVFAVGPVETTTARFEASVEPSVLDGDDALLLDYDLPANPTPVRRIIDEVRAVGDGVYLGAASVEAVGGYRFIFYFGLRR